MSVQGIRFPSDTIQKRGPVPYETNNLVKEIEYQRPMLHFISANPNVALCECCGRYFIPKTAKKTLYCDRIIKDNKTCKNLAPGLKHKLQAQNKKVVEEFDRAKQKMYKRYERALDPDKKVTEKAHGQLETREYYQTTDMKWIEQKL